MWRTYNLIQDFEIIVTKLNAVHYKLFPGMSTRQDTQTPLNLLTIHHGGIVELNNTWNVEGLGWKNNGDCKGNRLISRANALHWTGQRKPWSKHPLCKELWLEISGYQECRFVHS